MKPTGVRYAILGVATGNAFLLYLDRICMAAVVQSASFQKEMSLDKQSTGDVLAAFFFAYALGQMPAGWLADRFGPNGEPELSQLDHAGFRPDGELGSPCPAFP